MDGVPRGLRDIELWREDFLLSVARFFGFVIRPFIFYSCGFFMTHGIRIPRYVSKNLNLVCWICGVADEMISNSESIQFIIERFLGCRKI